MPRILPEFEGYTIDRRLKELRRLVFGETPEFVPFDSEKGKELTIGGDAKQTLSILHAREGKPFKRQRRLPLQLSPRLISQVEDELPLLPERTGWRARVFADGVVSARNEAEADRKAFQKAQSFLGSRMRWNEKHRYFKPADGSEYRIVEYEGIIGEATPSTLLSRLSW